MMSGDRIVRHDRAMERRNFLAGAAAAIIGATGDRAIAQPPGKIHRVALIVAATPASEMAGPDPINPAARAFLHAMRALGYVEGRNLVLDRRSADGQFERTADIVRELVHLKTDVIVASGNQIPRRAREVTATVPIVMATSFEPVETGFVRSLARPGGNLTGLTINAGPEIHGRRMQLLKEAVPTAARVAWLGVANEWDEQSARSARDAARVLRLTLIRADHAPTDYADAFAVIAGERPDALFVMGNPSNIAHHRLIVEFAARKRLPAIYSFREAADAGGLMAYGANISDLYRRAAGYVDKILKGAKPGDLPIEQPTKFELVVNLKTAKALGIAISTSILVQADEVIE